MITESYSEQETYAIGSMLGREAEAGQIYCLDGDLGTGKTVFARGFADGLGVREPVTSPTFTIIHEYRDGRIPLFHFDVYRIGDPGEMDAIGYEDYFYGDGVCLIEWSELISELIPDDAIRVNIRKDLRRGLDFREIEILGTGLSGKRSEGKNV